MDAVRTQALGQAASTRIFVQTEQKGTADALLAAREALEMHKGDVLVLYADTPLLTPETLTRLLDRLDDAQIAVLASRPPTRPVRAAHHRQGRWLTAIREENDATDAERRVKLCNSGVIGVPRRESRGAAGPHRQCQRQGEFYLTDAVAIAREAGARAGIVVCERTR